MVNVCCVKGCFTKQEDKIGLRSFPPIDSLLFEQWKIASRNDSLKDMDYPLIRKTKRVCNLHFPAKYRKRPMFLKHDYPMLIENMNDTVVDEINIVADSNKTVDNNLITVDHLYCKTVQVETEKMDIVTELNTCMEERKEVSVIKNVSLKEKRRRQLKKRVSYSDNLNIKYKKECIAFGNFKKINMKVQKFFNRHLINVEKKSRGESNDLDDNIFTRNIFRQSRKRYSYPLNLPSIATFKSNQIRVDPGLNDNVFNILKQHIRKKNGIEDRLVTLIFDEMSVVPHLDYLPNRGTVCGFEDDGYERTCRIADHAQVFMVRSIYRKWKLPVSYSFTQGTTKSSTIVQFIKEIVTRLVDIGYVVAAFVCDQGPTNSAAINMLLEDTKREYIKENKKPKKNIIRICNCEIVPLFDICDIIKCMRNHLLNKNLKFTLEGEALTASWEDIKTTYYIDVSRSSHFLKKISIRHIYPQKIPKMKISKAVQVFSYTVCATIEIYVDSKFSCPNGRKLSAESKGTASLCYFINDLFDSLNCGVVKRINAKKCVYMGSRHLQLWYAAKEVVKSMKFVNKRNEMTKQPAVLRNFAKTLDSYIMLHSILLKRMNFKYMPTRSFNQDPMKKSFGQLRETKRPSCVSIINRFSTLLVNNVIIANVRGEINKSNGCESIIEDLNVFLNETHEASSNLSKIMIELSLSNKHIHDEPIEGIIFSHLSVGILKRMEKLFVKNNCAICNTNIFARKEISFTELKQKNSYNRNYLRRYCSEVLLLSLINIFNITYHIMPNVLPERYDPYKLLKEYLKEKIVWKFEICAHTNDLIIKLLEEVSKILFSRYFQTLNGILKCDSQFADKQDKIQQSFLKYARKHKKNRCY
ncbi:PREDICTED: uncharacterized protein LOC108563776 [Nicrophorus vespilloides]|uniref:Uncharacterized protein LOC108563776 n=1 Tax=Nicrophorus vespilloides TaxID=110193 RepID=A0ABM1MTZ4_NICVS|nr:PREDICTED: uncharacterized protein LOC108563776 [Nicrophorus vespilloides]